MKLEILGKSSLVVAFVVLALATLTGCQKSAHAQSHQEQGQLADSKNQAESLEGTNWGQFEKICNLIEQRHIAPPSRQQMVLEAIRGLYRGKGLAPPRELAAEVSHCQSSMQFFILFCQKCKQLGIDIQAASTLRQMTRSLVESVDPLARWVDAKQFRIDRQLAENRYVGIGIRLKFENGYAVITEPFVGGAARNAGSQEGDVILEVDGESMKGKNLGQVVDILRGELDTRLTVKVKNMHSGESRVMKMVRTRVPIPSVKGVKRNEDDSWNYALGPQKESLAALKFEGIVGSTAAEVVQCMQEIDQQNFKAVVLDLRVSGDIEFHHAEMLADALSPQTVLGTYFDGGKKRVIRSRSRNCVEGKRLFVITNPYVTGPELVVIAALKKSGAILIGNRTQCSPRCGGQVILPGDMGAVANLSTAWFYPNMDMKNANNQTAARFARRFFFHADHVAEPGQHAQVVLDILRDTEE